MTKRTIISLAFMATALLNSCKQQEIQWTPAGDHMKSKWVSQVDPTDPLNEYPRPQMVRKEWKSLNGLWSYSITAGGEAQMGESDGRILVPFALESSLSGVGRALAPDQALWYKTEFKVPCKWKSSDVLLHFDAVDWSAEVYLNGAHIGSHTGGYTGFAFNVGKYLKAGKNELVVKVLDATDNDFQPRGKQVLDPKKIFYTAVSGIWQTVWLEPVSKTGYIADYKVDGDVDNSTVNIIPSVCGDVDCLEVSLIEAAVGYDTENPGSDIIATAKAEAGHVVSIKLDSPKLWTPESPYLYGVKITAYKDGKAVDQVDAYTALRKLGIKRDGQQHKRFTLNDKFIFEFGPLDQGWWPDGLYTAPTFDALRYDIDRTLDFGYNMIRKHVKVEPFRWYYYCDQKGMLVWQDMPSCAYNYVNGERIWNSYWSEYNKGQDYPLSDEAKANYYKEWSEIVNSLDKFQCIVCWVPFNEGWSQFNTHAMVDFTRKMDNSRPINAASGGNWWSIDGEGAGDILDTHNYKKDVEFLITDSDKVNVIGEYGGLTWLIKERCWNDTKKTGYLVFEGKDNITEQYVIRTQSLEKLAKEQGCSAAVYTQTTDVEIEVNGLMTYDREYDKLDVDKVRAANQSLIKAGSEIE